MKYLVRTLGCKANLADSQQLELELQRRGCLPCGDGEAASLCIVNSCTVTDEANRQSRKLAARLARENPGAAIVVTGCAAEVDPVVLAGSRGIQYVVGNRDKVRLVDLIFEKLRQISPASPSAGKGEILVADGGSREWASLSESFATPEVGLKGQSAKTRVFLRIQEGCDSFCTYCVIPYGRGPSRSLPRENVIRQIRDLSARGVKEVVITGTNIGDYDSDGEEGALEVLLHDILACTDIPRLRVGSLSPTEITPRILELIAENRRFCAHFHVSLQSASDRVLRLMKRPYGVEDVKRCLERIAELPVPQGGAFVGMDLITGFPGETLEVFEETMGVLKSLPWMRLHVFPYSEREGTPATRLPGRVAVEERARRARLLNALSLERLQRWHQETLLGLKTRDRFMTVSGILGERARKGPRGEEGNWVAGYTPNYIRVFARTKDHKSSEALENKVFDVAVDEEVFVDVRGGDVGFVGDVIEPIVVD